MNRHRNVPGTRLNPHDDMKGCMVFRPIMDMTTDDVWLLLLQRTPPWGGSHRELVTLYRNAQGGECPLVMDKSQPRPAALRPRASAAGHAPWWKKTVAWKR